LSTSEDLFAVLSICRENFQEFDTVNRVTALHRIARLNPQTRTCDQTDQTLITDRLLEDLHQQLTELKVQQLANTLWSLGRLQVSTQPILDGIAMCGVNNIQEFGAQECANFFWACGKMLWKNETLIEALSLHASQMAFELLPQHLGNIAWCMAKMKHVDMPLIDAITAKALQSIPESDQQEISNLV